MMQVGSASLELGDVQLAQVAGIDQPGSATSPGQQQQQQQLAKLLWGMGFLTLVMSAATFFHKPQAHGVLYVLVYYLTLVLIFVAGVVEVCTAFRMSQAHDDDDGDGRRRAFGRAVLLASVIPLATVAGLGGYTILFND
ncbi:hypothetical protein ABZP36_016617 [Zizania latifolia]